MSNTGYYVQAGATAAGAGIGFFVGGPMGAAVGGQIGSAVGSLFGGRSAKKKAKKYTKLAQQVQKQRETNATEAQFLQDIRQARITSAGSQAASAYAGLETSSLSSAALSSIRSQEGYNISYLAEDRRLFDLYSQYMRKAGKAADQYQNIQALGSLYSTLASAYGTYSSMNPAQAGTGTAGTTANGSSLFTGPGNGEGVQEYIGGNSLKAQFQSLQFNPSGFFG